MERAMTWYAIQRKADGVLLGTQTRANDGEFCCDVEYTFSAGEPPHLFLTHEDAELALEEDTEWYNAGPSTPSWGYAFNYAHEVEIVKVTYNANRSG